MGTEEKTYALTVHSERTLVVYYCNECGNPYLTDNDGTRSCICDHCRGEMGISGRAIEGE